MKDNSIFRMVAFILLIGSIIAGIVIGMETPKRAPLQPFAGLEKIKYMQELHLVTYNYEEMIVIGVPEKIKKENVDVDNLTNLYKVWQDSVVLDSIALFENQQALAAAEKQLEEANETEKTTKQAFQDKWVRRLFGKKKGWRNSAEYQAWMNAKQKVVDLKAFRSKKQKMTKPLEKKLTKSKRSLKRVSRDYQIAKERRDKKKNTNLNHAELIIVAPTSINGFINMGAVEFKEYPFDISGLDDYLTALKDSLNEIIGEPIPGDALSADSTPIKVAQVLPDSAKTTSS